MHIGNHPRVKRPLERVVSSFFLQVVGSWAGHSDCFPLVIDGWSNLSNIPILGVCVDEWLIDTIDTLGNRHTAEYLSEVMLQGLWKNWVNH